MNPPLGWRMRSVSGTSGANAPIAVSVPVPAAHLFAVLWSYSATPVGGTVTVDTSQDSLSYDIIAGGPGQLAFPPILSEGIDVTLAAGGGSVVGKVTVIYAVFP